MLFEQIFSFHSSIPAHNFAEVVWRVLTPHLEGHLVFYRMSVWKGRLCEYGGRESLLLLLLFIILILLAVATVNCFSTDSVACAMGKRSEPVFVLCD
jgi:hypothetical protein